MHKRILFSHDRAVMSAWFLAMFCCDNILCYRNCVMGAQLMINDLHHHFIARYIDKLYNTRVCILYTILYYIIFLLALQTNSILPSILPTAFPSIYRWQVTFLQIKSPFYRSVFGQSGPIIHLMQFASRGKHFSLHTHFLYTHSNILHT